MSDVPGITDVESARRIRCEAAVQKRTVGALRIVTIRVGTTAGKDWRISKYIAAACPRYSRALCHRWVEAGYTTVDGHAATLRHRMKPGQTIRMEIPIDPAIVAHEAPGPLQILYEDERLLVLNKPAGQLAHPAGRNLSGTLLNQLFDWMREHSLSPDEVRLVNRIDRDTSGIVLASLDLEAHVALTDAMRRGEFHKEYLALCQSVCDPVSGHWQDPIRKAGAHTIAMAVHPEGKASHTEYRMIEADPTGRFCLVSCILHTGRQHQIRLHAAHNGHPLVADWVYGRPAADLPGQALHAWRLKMPHPSTGTMISVEAPLDETIAELWERLKSGGEPVWREHTPEELSRLGQGDTPAPKGPYPDWLSPEDLAAISAERGDAVPGEDATEDEEA